MSSGEKGYGESAVGMYAKYSADTGSASYTVFLYIQASVGKQVY